jgi:hypothetical protein
MSEQIDPSTTAPTEPFDAPPPSPMPAQSPGDAARSRLMELASALQRSPNRRLLVEYLQMRRSLR